jgi:hypothetical protein
MQAVLIVAAFGIVSAILPGPTDLQVEYVSNPNAVSISQPRLSWRTNLNSNFTKGLLQAAFQLQLSSLQTGELIWDTGIVVCQYVRPGPFWNDHCVVRIPLPRWLSTMDRHCSRLRATPGTSSGGQIMRWNNIHLVPPRLIIYLQTSAWSSRASFTYALGSEADWHNAQYLGKANRTQLRATFTLSDKPIERGQAFVLAPGCFVLAVRARPARPY